VRAVAILAVLALGGCLGVPGPTGDDDDDLPMIDAGGDDAGGDGDGGSSTCGLEFVQTFDDPDELDAWGGLGDEPACTVSITSGAMVFDIAAAMATCRVVSSACFDVRERAVGFVILNPNADLSLYVGILLPDGSPIFLERDDDVVRLSTCDQREEECTTNPFDLPIADEATELALRVVRDKDTGVLRIEQSDMGEWALIPEWSDLVLASDDAADVRLAVGTRDEAREIPSGNAKLGMISVYAF
jgi:hypothetical protein